MDAYVIIMLVVVFAILVGGCGWAVFGRPKFYDPEVQQDYDEMHPPRPHRRNR